VNLFLPDTIASFPEQRTHVATDNSYENGHCVNGDVLVAGFDERDILLCQASPLSQLSLRQAGLNSGSSRVLAKNLPQVRRNRRIALGRFLRRTLRHALPQAPIICYLRAKTLRAGISPSRCRYPTIKMLRATPAA
jgi:hypothetical protein